jgi:UDP-N-acetylmuramoylalanine--D-glutamate ligase
VDVGGQKTVVIGLGASGRAAARFLARRGARVFASDISAGVLSEAEIGELEQAGITVETGGHSAGLLDSAELVVLSPGVDPAGGVAAEAISRGIPTVSEIEVAARACETPLIGITGSNGKSTTTALAAEMLQASGIRTVAGGNLGRAFASIVDEEADLEVIVLELSSFQLELIETFRAGTGVLLNVTPDHLDRHPTLEAYEAAKARLWANQLADDWAIYSADDPGAVRLTETAGSEKIPVTLGSEPAGFGAWIGTRNAERVAIARLPGHEAEEVLFPVASCPLPGPHNLGNALAAAVAARRYGAESGAIERALRDFRGLPHRLELIADKEGVRFYNDSKATNVDSARAALSGFESGVVLIAGGRYKGVPFTPLHGELARCGRAAVLIGESRPWLKAELDGSVPLHEAESLAEAVTLARDLARPEGIVLLAPACSSFDMFSNYEERGDLFRQAVLELVAADDRGSGVQS